MQPSPEREVSVRADAGAEALALTEAAPLGRWLGAVLDGRFRVETLVAQGGMGVVFRAFDLERQCDVAIKVIVSSQLEDESRFAREAAILASLSHPAIVDYVGHGRADDGTPYLAMEWLQGETLCDRLARETLSLEQSFELLRAICSGLALAHAHGVVHRDLKPSNLFLLECDPLRPKILDFGLARRFADRHVYAFSHSLLREAAYAMLSEIDKRQGHALAGDWLERAGETSALALANHFELGGEPERAVAWLINAAEAAADGGNARQAIALAERGRACGASGLALGRLCLSETQALAMFGDMRSAVTAAREAMKALPAGSTEWYRGAACLLLAGSHLSDQAISASALQEVLSVQLQPRPSGSYGFATFAAIQAVLHLGQSALARAILERARASQTQGPDDPVFRAWLLVAASLLNVLDAELGQALSELAEAHALAETTGAALALAVSGLYTVAALSQTGHVERTDETAAQLFEYCKPLNVGTVVDWAHFFQAWTQLITEQTDRAMPALAALLDRSDEFLRTNVRSAYAQALLTSDRVLEADALLTEQDSPFLWSRATVLRARALIAQHTQQPFKALDFAERGLAAATQASYPVTVSALALVRARALSALGRTEEAHEAILAAQKRVLRMAASLPDPQLRAACLERISVHVQTLEPAARWSID